MCGISGVVSKRSGVDIRSMLSAMNDKISHRGPDGSGFYYADDCGLGLGHRRLSIIDLSDSAGQPMKYNDKYVVIFNGEIYNYIEIRQELIKEGYHFYTSSDTEVILAAYDFWGTNCFQHFNGMWALCIFDINAKKLILSRDRFGVKPLYFFNSPDIFLFGSEIKQITAVTGKMNLNVSVFNDFLFYDAINHNNETFYQGIEKLMPGHVMEYNLVSHEHLTTPFYELKADASIRQMNDEDASDYYLNLLESSIKLRLRSDVQVGTCLSGGLDSSYIAAVAARNYTSNNKFIAITAKSSEANRDETSYAKQVAEAYDLEHIIVEPGIKDYEEALPLIVGSQDEPFGGPSIVMQYFVMRAARASGCKVMLDGQGGDETLLGYERYFFLANRNKNVAAKLFDYYHISKNSKLSFLDAVKYGFYFNNTNLRTKVLKNRFTFLKDNVSHQMNASLMETLSNTNATTIEAAQVNEIKYRLLPLLHYEDKNSMCHSIEARLPFLDYRVVEAAIALPVNLKIRNGWSKYLLRQGAEKLLPHSIAWRKNKFGFEAPASTWMKNSEQIKRSIMADPYLKEIIKNYPDQTNANVIWRLYSYSLWAKQASIVP